MQVREQNLYCEGDRIPAKQELTEFHLRRCWNDLMTKINYEDRVAEIEKFNKFVANYNYIITITLNRSYNRNLHITLYL